MQKTFLGGSSNDDPLGLKDSLEMGQIRPIDFYFGKLLDPSLGSLAFAACLVSYAAGQGHSALPLACLVDPGLLLRTTVKDGEDPAVQPFYQRLPERCEADWQSFLESSPTVSTGAPAPLVLDRSRLYLHRLWEAERCISDYFRQKSLHPFSIAALDSLCADRPHRPSTTSQGEIPFHPRQWQEVALALCLSQRVCCVAGGPGTGKSTLIKRFMQRYLTVHPQPSEGLGRLLRLAAPTGRAAGRLNDLIRQQTNGTGETNYAGHDPQASVEAVTLHRLLGLQRSNRSPKYHAHNPLPIDCLVVDEASMIDIELMRLLIEALPETAQLILLGDPNQLASIEAGSVFRDLCSASAGLNPRMHQRLAELLGVPLPLLAPWRPKAPGGLSDTVIFLKHTHRFASTSGIAACARALETGDSSQVTKILHKEWADLHWLQCRSDLTRYRAAIEGGYQAYFSAIAEGKPLEAVWQAFAQFRCLNAVHNGVYGTHYVNELCLKKLLQTLGLCEHSIGKGFSSLLYPGLPVLVTQNMPSLGVANGDIGMVWDPAEAFRTQRTYSPRHLCERQAQFLLHFPQGGQGWLTLSPHRLQALSMAYALSVHKAQGSEFSHVLITVPEGAPESLMTREWLYTAITRAQKQVTVCATEAALQEMIQRSVTRYGGLPERLWAPYGQSGQALDLVNAN